MLYSHGWGVHTSLGFEYEHTANLLGLCGQYFSKWTKTNYHIDKVLIKYTCDPKVEVRHIGFRRLEQEIEPIQTAMIRCNKRWAVIKGVEDCYAYMLTRNKSGVFYIYGRFSYKEDRSHPLKYKNYTKKNFCNSIGNFRSNTLTIVSKYLFLSRSDQVVRKKFENSVRTSWVFFQLMFSFFATCIAEQ